MFTDVERDQRHKNIMMKKIKKKEKERRHSNELENMARMIKLRRHVYTSFLTLYYNILNLAIKSSN